MRHVLCVIALCLVWRSAEPLLAWHVPPAAAQRDTAILDGTADIDEAALADLALERALLGGRWLANVVHADGSFYYTYDPVSDRYDTAQYNEVRHAGTTYALFQLYGVTGDGQVLVGAERAAGYIAANSVPVPLIGRGYVDPADGIVKLGDRRWLWSPSSNAGM